MNIFVYGGNWYNRGDESAIRAMIDELLIEYPKANIRLHINNGQLVQFYYNNIPQVQSFNHPTGRNKLKCIPYYLSIYSLGKINLLKGENRVNFEKFIDTVQWADIVVYAPGGPMIGDLYDAKFLLDQLDIIRLSGTPYVFFAPSMGPFRKNKRRIRKILNSADLICLRENISQKYIQQLGIDKETIVTLDSAFQHNINFEQNEKIFQKDIELQRYMNAHKKNIGITVTDLLWHRNFKNGQAASQIQEAFEKFLKYILCKGYGVVFIPQLFGKDNDMKYMQSFAKGECYVVSDENDCYYQQYLISKMYAVVGMRYHSNIFSAKMGTPFVSVSYEQKMEGFMEKAGLSDYCISIERLSAQTLVSKFELMEKNYSEYKAYLSDKKEEFKSMSHATTDMVCKVIDGIQ